jgi:hypothetical protein
MAYLRPPPLLADCTNLTAANFREQNRRRALPLAAGPRSPSTVVHRAAASAFPRCLHRSRIWKSRSRQHCTGFPDSSVAGEAEGRRGVRGGELGRPLIACGERTRSSAKRFLDDDIMSYILVFMQKIWLYLLQFC